MTFSRYTAIGSWNRGIRSLASIERNHDERGISHQDLIDPANHRMLHLLQIVLHQVQPIDTLFEMLRQHGEQRGDLGILEVLEFADDVVAFFSGSHPVHKAFQPLAAQAKVVDALREHAGKKQRVIADVFAHLAFAVERRSGPKDRIRFDEHFADIPERFTGGVADLEQLPCITKFRQQMRDVVYDLRIANADLFGIVASYKLNKKLLKRMRFRNHPGLLPKSQLLARHLSHL